MKQKLTRTIRIIVGCLLVALGIVGLALPVLQGFLFLGLGGALLYRDIPVFNKGINWLRKRVPALDRIADRARKAMRRRRQ